MVSRKFSWNKLIERSSQFTGESGRNSYFETINLYGLTALGIAPGESFLKIRDSKYLSGSELFGILNCLISGTMQGILSWLSVYTLSPLGKICDIS